MSDETEYETEYVDCNRCGKTVHQDTAESLGAGSPHFLLCKGCLPKIDEEALTDSEEESD